MTGRGLQKSGIDPDFSLGELRGYISGLRGTVDRVEQILLGDGQPGVVERLIRIEEGVRKLDGITNRLVEQEKQMLGMERIVQEHLQDKDMHTWRVWFSQKTISCLIVAYVLVYSILESIPDGWKFLIALF